MKSASLHDAFLCSAFATIRLKSPLPSFNQSIRHRGSFIQPNSRALNLEDAVHVRVRACVWALCVRTACDDLNILFLVLYACNATAFIMLRSISNAHREERSIVHTHIHTDSFILPSWSFSSVYEPTRAA